MCVCVGAFVRACVYVCARVDACVRAFMCVRSQVCAHVCVGARMHMCMYGHARTLKVFIRAKDCVRRRSQAAL